MHNSSGPETYQEIRLGASLDSLLEHELRPIAAPDGLWDRIGRPPVTRRAQRFVPPQLALTAMLLVVVSGMAIFFVRHTDGERSRQALALEALARDPDALELRSDTASEIRTWVKSKTGLDLPLPAAPSRAVEMTGVCALKGGTPAVEVAYRVGGHAAALVVSKAGLPTSSDETHKFLKCKSVGSARVSSWTMRGQLYTLAYASSGEGTPGGNKEECLLCHAGERAVTVSN